ncbi:MAG: ABC transporter ATP-binding protein [Chloroflexota bacterium]|nr:ABC transporter ATP-binding protein [Chloroflexota bacterium]
MARVRLLNVTKRYGSVVAAERVNLDVADGEFVTLLGPSGCGKTTTLRMIAGLVETSEGEIYFDDQEVSHVPPNRRNVGFVFQSHALFPHLSVYDNVAYGLSVRGAPRHSIQARVEEMLALVNLSGYDKRMPAQLSGGQQQRVALARVLAPDPRVLLFDEPLSSLDRNLRDQLKHSIRELQQKSGKTAIFVTHDQSEAFAISDRIFVMNAGRVEQGGTQLELYMHPTTPFVAEFLGTNNCLRGVVAHSRDESETGAVVSVQVGAHTFTSPAGRALEPGTRVLAYLRPENISVLQGAGNGSTNLLDGVVERIVFDGSTVHVHVDTDVCRLLVEVGGSERLELMAGAGSQVQLGFDDLTLIPEPLTPTP